MMSSPSTTSTTTNHPRALINSPERMQSFITSNAYAQLTGFIAELTNAARTTRPQDNDNEQENETTNQAETQAMVSSTSCTSESEDTAFDRSVSLLLDTCMELVSSCPRIEGARARYGNPGFRVWVDTVAKHADEVLTELLSGVGCSYSDVSPYFVNAFGSYERLDYGTGHELNFIAFLLCLSKIFPASSTSSGNSYSRMVFSIFTRYIRVVRCVQEEYSLEPAGSHGVWGLDDFNHMVYILGASQLRNHRFIRPRSSLNSDVLEGYADKYIFLDQVRHVVSVKHGAPLSETSPMLYDICRLRSWESVLIKLMQLYESEVLGKWPVMQHFCFGKYINFGVEDDESG